jgi:hypothetical protein
MKATFHNAHVDRRGSVGWFLCLAVPSIISLGFLLDWSNPRVWIVGSLSLLSWPLYFATEKTVVLMGCALLHVQIIRTHAAEEPVLIALALLFSLVGFLLRDAGIDMRKRVGLDRSDPSDPDRGS